ncbi:hypothetical protein [Gemmatimonas groenlandica]|uniref:Lipoprotein n=1 Tax=Gemmatimonas groenlandica TaxID=2732249 RepID=A0A6M4IKR4_9BACT|nr:hypothetical protein [Gemmatimonas groenlandica]QJR35230.1 hypothetical protein HKW67_06790 [Gemmatimonas groenlandica]
MRFTPLVRVAAVLFSMTLLGCPSTPKTPEELAKAEAEAVDERLAERANEEAQRKDAWEREQKAKDDKFWRDAAAAAERSKWEQQAREKRR